MLPPASVPRRESTSPSVLRYIHTVEIRWQHGLFVVERSFGPEWVWSVCLPLQQALRLIAFGKAHLVLGVDPLLPPGTRREPHGERAGGEKAREEKAEEEKMEEDKEGEGGEAELGEPDAKKPRTADPTE